jgi:hypothetical protein
MKMQIFNAENNPSLFIMWDIPIHNIFSKFSKAMKNLESKKLLNMILPHSPHITRALYKISNANCF